MLFKITDIDWDTETDDGEEPDLNDLPQTLMIEIDDRYDINPPLNIAFSNEQEYEQIIEDIVNQLSDTHAWCVNNCTITRIQ